MNVCLGIKNKKHEKIYNDHLIDSHTNPSIHRHVILGISVLPLTTYNQYLSILDRGRTADQIVTSVVWIFLLFLLLVVGLVVMRLNKRLQKRRREVRFCLDIFYTLISGYLAWVLVKRAQAPDHLEVKFGIGWYTCFITVAIIESISRWYLKVLSYLAIICTLYIKVYVDTRQMSMILAWLQLLIYLTLSTYFSHRDAVKRFIEKQKMYEETQTFRDIFDQTTDGILIYGLKEGEISRNWKNKKQYHWWNEQLSVEENLKAIKVEQKKMLVDNLEPELFNTSETARNLEEPEESSLSGLLDAVIRTLISKLALNLEEIQQTQNLMVVTGRFETGNQEEGTKLALSKEAVRTANLLEIKVMALIFREKPALALIFHDITERSLIDVLEDNNNYKNRLLASVSHELRTPLNASINLVQAAIDDPRLPASVKEDLLIPSLDSNRLLLYLINDILDFSQMSANKLRLVFEKADIKQTIEDCLNLITMQVNKKNLSIETDIVIETPTPQICTDHNRLKQIILNFLSNAIKFTLEGSIKLTVKLMPSPEYNSILYVEVSDTGIGISEEDQKRLFKVYEKIELGRRTSLNSSGVGLGLVISNNLVQMLGPLNKNQAIKVESTLNKGSTFSFWITEKKPNGLSNDANVTREIEDHSTSMEELSPPKRGSNNRVVPHLDSPLKFEEKNILSKQHATISNSASKPRCSCPRILVVDDNVFNIIALQTILSKFGYVSDTAYNGQVAIDKIKQRQENPCSKNCRQFDLVFMDCNMPILDGFEATKRLKEMMLFGEISTIAIVGCTALVQPHELQRALDSGMNECCTKPLEREKISEFLKIFVGK